VGKERPKDRKMEFCTKKTTEQMQKDSTEYTRKELEKLTALIKARPEVLHRERRVNRDNREYQEDQEDLDDLVDQAAENRAAESRNYYLTLELSNAMNENATLRTQIEGYKQKDDILAVITVILHLNAELQSEMNVKPPRTFSVKEITSEVYNLQTFYEKKSKKIGACMDRLTGFKTDETNGPLLTHYINSLEKISKKLDAYYKQKLHQLEALIMRKHRVESVTWMCMCLCFVFLAYFVSPYFINPGPGLTSALSEF
jgi:hypothetical protein